MIEQGPVGIKRMAYLVDSDQEDEEEPIKVKKQRLDRENEFTPTFSEDESVGFISPPITPTPIPNHRRATSDISMEDLEMADSQPNSQPWTATEQTQACPNTFLPSVPEIDTEIARPHTPGILTRSLTRLEVSPSVMIPDHGACLPANDKDSANGDGNVSPGGSVTLVYPHIPKKRFTMGYRADCEKCRMKVPGHTIHRPIW